MGDKNGQKKRGGAGNASKFATTQLSWYCKPCDWRNPPSANFCSHCGKAKQWVHDKNRAPADPQAAALKKATDTMRQEFRDFVKDYVKGQGKGRRGGGGGGKGGNGGKGGKDGGKDGGDVDAAKGKGEGGKAGGNGGNKGGGKDVDPIDATEPKPKPKITPGRDIFVPYEGKSCSLNDLHEMLRALAPRMGDDHIMVVGIREAIDAAHEKRYEQAEPEDAVKHLEAAIARKEGVLDKHFNQIAELRDKRDEIDKQIKEVSTRMHNEDQQLKSMRKQLENAKAMVGKKGVSYEPTQLDSSLGQTALKDWIKATAPELHGYYEDQGWKCTISERMANQFLDWKTHNAKLHRFQRHAQSRTKDEVQGDEVAAALAAIKAMEKLDHQYFPSDLEPLPQCFPILGATDKAIDTLLDSWCCPVNGGCVRPAKPKRTISGPYFRPKQGVDPECIECKPIADDLVEEARAILFQHDPEAKQFVQGIENDMGASTQSKLDVLCYMDVVMQHKDRVNELVSVQEYIEVRKRARVESEAAMGINSPRLR